MPAKRVQVSSDDAAYFTLPGNSGELRSEAGELTDTVFGQLYDSSEAGLITGTLNSNALYKGFAGYIVKLQKGGTPIVMTAEPMALVSGKTYVVTATTKQYIDPYTPITVFVTAVNQNANVQDINFATGEVTFLASFTPGGAVTITGAYIPLTDIAGAKTFTLTQTAVAIDISDIPTVKANAGYRLFNAEGLKTVSIELGGVYKLTNGFAAALAARQPLFININPDNADLSVCKGVFKYTARGQSGDVGALEEETVSLRLNVPPDQTGATWTWKAPIAWKHSVSSKLSTAVIKILDAWQNGTTLHVKYLPDGSTGVKFSGCVVTDVTLSGGLEAMNEFAANFQLNGAPTTI